MVYSGQIWETKLGHKLNFVPFFVYFLNPWWWCFSQTHNLYCRWILFKIAKPWRVKNSPGESQTVVVKHPIYFEWEFENVNENKWPVEHKDQTFVTFIIRTSPANARVFPERMMTYYDKMTWIEYLDDFRFVCREKRLKRVWGVHFTALTLTPIFV